MYSNGDLASLYDFLRNTPEGSLRKMMVGGKVTAAHFSLLMKLAKNSPEGDFIAAFNGESLPKMKFSPAENQIRDTFWAPCKEVFLSLGLLKATQPKQAA